MTIAEEMRAHAKAARGRLRRSPNAKPDHGGEMNFRWTKENIGRLKALVADSLTAS